MEHRRANIVNFNGRPLSSFLTERQHLNLIRHVCDLGPGIPLDSIKQYEGIDFLVSLTKLDYKMLRSVPSIGEKTAQVLVELIEKVYLAEINLVFDEGDTNNDV